jgi:hypothetical protein
MGYVCLDSSSCPTYGHGTIRRARDVFEKNKCYLSDDYVIIQPYDIVM